MFFPPDIDECKLDGFCQPFETCVNSFGSYNCEKKNVPCLQSGYEFNFTSGRCEDIDECLKRPCKSRQNCINLDGSYRCECEAGLRVDNKTNVCVDINECVEYPELCQQKCTNFHGGFRCSCHAGYQVKRNEDTECEDIDECLTNRHNCGSSDICENTDGSFQCIKALTCGRGYRINENKTECHGEIFSYFNLRSFLCIFLDRYQRMHRKQTMQITRELHQHRWPIQV